MAGTPAEFALSIPCQYISTPQVPGKQRFVSVRVVSTRGILLLNKAVREGVRNSPELVLIQTDKPIYTENDDVKLNMLKNLSVVTFLVCVVITVNIRAVVLGCNFAPCCGGGTDVICLS